MSENKTAIAKKSVGKLKCLHCGYRVSTRGRQLCQPCFRDIRIRLQYPLLDSSQKGGGVGLTESQLKIPEPTDAMPGSLEKIEVLQRRLLRGERLHHPLDAVDQG